MMRETGCPVSRLVCVACIAQDFLGNGRVVPRWMS